MMLILVIFRAASGKNDYVEVYCGNEMRKYLGLTREEQEARTVPPKTVDGSVVTGGPTNWTAPDTPNIISDMGKKDFLLNFLDETILILKLIAM